MNKKAKGPISRSGRLCRFSADAALPVGVDKPDDSCDEDQFDCEMKPVEDGLEAGVGVPVIAELHADVGKCIAPWPGADKCVKVEAELIHAGDAGG